VYRDDRRLPHRLTSILTGVRVRNFGRICVVRVKWELPAGPARRFAEPERRADKAQRDPFVLLGTRGGEWGLCVFFVPIRGELARRPGQPLQYPIVADAVHGESPSDVAEHYVQLAVIFLDHSAAGRLGGAPVPVVRGKGATGEISFVIHRPFGATGVISFVIHRPYLVRRE
jgi:hypothetical protein